MRRRTWAARATLLLSLFILGSATAATAQPGAAVPVDPEVRATLQRQGSARVIVELRTPRGSHVAEGALAIPGAVDAQRQAIAAARAPVLANLAGSLHRVVRQFSSVPFVALEVGDAALRTLEASGFSVVRVFEDEVFFPQLATSGPLVGADQVWTRGFDGTGLTVAVLDTGVEATHPFLAGKVVEEACFTRGQCPNGQSTQFGSGAGAPCPAPGCYHGTHVIGVAVGDGATGGVPFSGVAPGASIIAVQIFNDLGGGDLGAFFSDVMAALEWVYELRDQHQIASVNVSVASLAKHTSPCDTDPMKPIIDNLRAAGIATVVATGNEAYRDGVGKPSCISSSVSVAASTMDDVPAGFTNVSAFTSLVAPGLAIEASIPGGGYGLASGTSFSAPHVAGAFAALRQAAPAASVDDILAALQATGIPVADTRSGGSTTRPRIELGSALDQLIGPETTPPSVTITAPANGAGVSGTILVSATAADNSHVAQVQFLLDGALLGAADASAPYAIGWETATAAPGSHTLTAVATDASGNTTTSAPIVVTVAGGGTTQAVVWVSAVKATVNGNTVTKTSGCEGCADAGAASQQTIASGNGSIEFSVSPNELLTVGLSNGNATTSSAEIKFGLRFHLSTYQVRESNEFKAEFTKAPGTPVYKIAVENGVVKYYENGVLKYTSTQPPTYPLVADTTLLTLGATAQNVTITTGSSGGTPSPPPDTTPPAVAITSPATGGSLLGTVNVTATASDNVAIVGVQFKVDGVNLGPEDTTPPYEVSWDTMTAGRRWHTLTAVARDAAGNTTTSEEVHIVTPGPGIDANFTSPFHHSFVQGTVLVGMRAENTQPPTRFTLVLGNAITLLDQSGPETTASYAWDTTAFADGDYTLTMTVRDSTGRSITGSTILKVRNNGHTAPTVVLTAPAHGTTVSGTVALTATAGDDSGVKHVCFTVDGFCHATDFNAPYGVTWDTTTEAPGWHRLMAVAQDLDGNWTSSAPVDVLVGAEPLVASFTSPANGSSVQGTVTVGMEAPGAQGTPISFTLTLDGTTTLMNESGTASTASYSWNTLGVADGAHTLALTVEDGEGRTATSSITVTVSNADTAPPTVAITAPANGATGSGTVTVSANASDNVGVTSVQFKLDGVDLGTADTTAPYGIAWDTTTAANGPHTLTAVAHDAAGNTTTSSPITVTVDNPPPGGDDPTPPTVAITAPSSGAWTGGSIAVKASASDNVGLTSIKVYGNGGIILETACSGTSCLLDSRWTTSALPSGAYQINAVATDTAGNCAISPTVVINKNATSPVKPSGATCGGGDTTPPSVAVTAPAEGATVDGTVTVTASASDNLGVASVQFMLDGAPLGALDTSAPFTLSWDSTTAADGSHTLTAVAKDPAGNTATSAPVIVTVSNGGPPSPGDPTPPTVAITAPTTGAWTGNSIAVKASASDNAGLASIKVYGNGGVILETACSGASCLLDSRWTTGTLPSGAYQINAVATDAAGNCAVSATVTINKNATTPVKPSGAPGC